jgi:DNA polymerase-1
VTYPNIPANATVCIDIETHDPGLLDLGPGYHRAKINPEQGRILVVSVAVEGREWTYPWSEGLQSWLRDRPDLSVIGANTLYDLGWLSVWGGVRFSGRIWDVLITESVLDYSGGWYSLDKLAKQYLDESKKNTEIIEYAEAMGWKGDARQHLSKMPEDLVLRYASGDTSLTWRVWEEQNRRIGYDLPELARVVDLESRLLPVLLAMRERGVRVATEKLAESHAAIDREIASLNERVTKLVGREVNAASSAEVGAILEAEGFTMKKTATGQLSVTKDVLASAPSEFAGLIHEIRELRKLQSTYLEGLERFIVGGRVYTEFLPVKNGGRGTATGRFSAQNPALQTIPSRGRGKDLARRLFLPEDGMLWEKQDQSQEEYRIFAHYARGGGADKLRADFHNPDMDMHTWTRDFVGFSRDKAGRQLAKTLNFLSLYGGGVHKFATAIGKPVPPPWNFDWANDSYQDQITRMRADYEAARLYFAYHNRLPCIKETGKAAARLCEARGYARTLFGRRRKIPRDKSYKALNTAVQGTGGDIMKLWMVSAWEAGLLDGATIVPGLTVHDELDFSVAPGPEGDRMAREIQHIGEVAMELRVPLKVDRERGPNWAEVKEL